MGASGGGPGGGATFRLTLAYLGTPYHGWQRQTNALGVQQVVEEAVEKLVGHPVRIVAASRTDAGVHARGQEVHLRLERAWPGRALVEGANHYLPGDVRVLAAAAVCPAFDARKWAMAKEYRYRLSRARVLQPFEAAMTVSAPSPLDVDRLRAAVALLPGRHDFAAFARSGGAHTQTCRRVFTAELREREALVELRLIGDGFLRGMVRALVGTLLWVARGRIEPCMWARLLEGGRRAEAGPSAPAKGLTLMRVIYPETLLE